MNIKIRTSDVLILQSVRGVEIIENSFPQIRTSDVRVLGGGFSGFGFCGISHLAVSFLLFVQDDFRPSFERSK